MPLCVALETGAGVTPNPTMCIDSSVPVAIYAWLYTFHFQSFFSWRNRWISGMNENTSIVDERIYFLEILLHVLMCTHLVWPIRHMFGLQKKDVLFCFKFPSFFTSFLCMVVIGAFILIYVSLVAMNKVYVETFRVVWVLLWGFPAFMLVSTLGSEDAIVTHFASTFASAT
ncbi:hypothetical protein TraAM80_08938 [Trypanosoma rangeli]|uniref:Uncharacterized protein n=1 Tax=Trypanosoma rangeli TaxID=5698 RepID=A0A3R7LIY8_TRYRA|nr:uncharacterized protein TraAM80_08938 [Trypanosoma rangeli]RNE98144.1 hypothetical protein TraAM80_08938 [Trypanosoma rangeli]|eukprot:RNE98144.1 hypothetical protein TraAM80_08938 [Trypanosoma rangeli]